MSMFLENVLLDGTDPDSIAFQVKILEKSGFSEETCIPPSLTCLPIRKSLSFALEEVTTVMFSAVSDLFENFEDIAREGSNNLFTKSYLSSRRIVHLLSQREKNLT